MNLFLLQSLLVLSTLIECTYDLGAFTRKHVLPLVVYLATAVYYYGVITFDSLCDNLNYELKVIRTPLTTGLA